MSRFFNGPTTADAITFAVGNAPPDQGPITIAVLAKAANTSGFTGWMIQARATTTAVWSILTSNNVGAKLFMENDFTAGNAGLTTGWAWYVATKASGASTPRWHIHDLTAATAWSHANAGGTVGDGTGPITNILVGGNLSAGSTWRGSIAVVAAWDSVLSDVAIEAAMTSAAADTLAATPKWMVRLNQASTATSVTDDTGGGGDQTALAGTSVDADDPPAYNYALTSSAAPSGISMPIALGTPAVALSRTAAPSGIAMPITLGTPSAGVLVSPAGLALPIAVGTPVAGPTVLDLTAAPGSWRGLVATDALNRQYAQDQRRAPAACPNDGEPLELVHGRLHCRYDGWIDRGWNRL